MIAFIRRIWQMNTIVLLGIKHCGKSTIGKELEQRTRLPFYDIDAVIEEQTGEGCRQYYRTYGKEAFMKAEAEAARHVAHRQKNSRCIIATGGGICDNQDALNALRTTMQPRFILLDIDEPTAFSRIQSDYNREGTWPAYIARENPVTTADAERIFHGFYLRRVEAYKKISDDVVSVKNKSPLIIADEILN